MCLLALLCKEGECSAGGYWISAAEVRLEKGFLQPELSLAPSCTLMDQCSQEGSAASWQPQAPVLMPC